MTVPASANGGDFFNELAESWGANVDTGTPFFGFVRDDTRPSHPARDRHRHRAARSGRRKRHDHLRQSRPLSDPGPRQGHLGEGHRDRVRQGGLSRVQQDRRIMRTMPKAPVEVNCRLSSGRRSDQLVRLTAWRNFELIAIAAMKLHLARAGTSSMTDHQWTEHSARAVTRRRIAIRTARMRRGRGGQVDVHYIPADPARHLRRAAGRRGVASGIGRVLAEAAGPNRFRRQRARYPPAGLCRSHHDPVRDSPSSWAHQSIRPTASMCVRRWKICACSTRSACSR